MTSSVSVLNVLNNRDLTTHILARLPDVTDVVRAGAVCKLWRDITQNVAQSAQSMNRAFNWTPGMAIKAPYSVGSRPVISSGLVVRPQLHGDGELRISHCGRSCTIIVAEGWHTVAMETFTLQDAHASIDAVWAPSSHRAFFVHVGGPNQPSTIDRHKKTRFGYERHNVLDIPHPLTIGTYEISPSEKRAAVTLPQGGLAICDLDAPDSLPLLTRNSGGPWDSPTLGWSTDSGYVAVHDTPSDTQVWQLSDGKRIWPLPPLLRSSESPSLQRDTWDPWLRDARKSCIPRPV